MRRFSGAARVAVLCAVAITAARTSASSQEPFRPKGRYNNSVHRFFPDLDCRFNAVRYGRWRALEIAWRVGVNPELDREFSSFLLKLLSDPPRFAPEAEFIAPRFAREASSVFHALHWGQVFEQQVSDTLASADATPELTAERLQRALEVYRREQWALLEPKDEAQQPEALQLAPMSARILLSGTRLFVLAAEGLAAADFGQQRWKVRDTIAEFDSSLDRDTTQEQATYRVSAPTVSDRYPVIAATLDRLARFRTEVYSALATGGASGEARKERNARLTAVAQRYGIPFRGIGAE
ncbi:MAG TPA: hypothetical protein VF958_03755 [Thermoanaerobaculia bacterium]